MKHLLLFQTFLYLKNSYSSFAVLSLHLLILPSFRPSIFQGVCDVRYTTRFFPLKLCIYFTKPAKRTIV